MAVFTFCLAVSQINILTKDERNEHLSAHYINIGIQYMKSNQLPEAITNFQMSCKLAPHSDWNQTRLSAAYFKNKEYNKALSIMSKVYPKHPHIEEVAGLYADLLAIKGKYSDAHYVLGVALQINGRLDEAIEHYTETLRSDPNYAAAHNNLGVIFRLKGNVERAANHFRKALQISPDLAGAKNSLDALLEEEKDKDNPL